MQKEDREEVRQILTDVLAGYAAKQEGQYENLSLKIDNLDYKVEQIQIQTTKTNGRVTALETKPHPIANCPQATIIDQLYDDVATIKTERKFTIKVAAFVAAAITALTSFLKFFVFT
jgi:hypothetical protein